jgi:hypothetical protein
LFNVALERPVLTNISLLDITLFYIHLVMCLSQYLYCLGLIIIQSNYCVNTLLPNLGGIEPQVLQNSDNPTLPDSCTSLPPPPVFETYASRCTPDISLAAVATNPLPAFPTATAWISARVTPAQMFMPTGQDLVV